MSWMLGLDFLIAVLLAGVITAAVFLNRKLDRARGDWQSLEALAGEFRAATDRAGESIQTLKLSTAAIGREVERADTLVEDLRFLLERGSALADRLETDVRAARGSEPPPRSPAAAQQPLRQTPRQPAKSRDAAGRPEPAPELRAHAAADDLHATSSAPRSQAERALLEALRATP